ncbi:MAG TPA: trigger factor [Candidatus Paceibacterota bacterium]|nr:trigger factor [Candidatus Paceibacterota bacterium]
MNQPPAETLYEKLKVRRNKNSEAEIEAEIPSAIVGHYVAEISEKARRDFTLPGFRKGQVPADIFRQHVNEMHILEDAVDEILQDVYPTLIENEKLPVIGRPEVQITKLAPGNPIAFKMTVALQPEFSLPDYKKIGRAAMEKKETATVTDAEIDEAVKQLQLMRLRTTSGAPAPKDQIIPALTDEEAKKFGPFENVAAFRTKLRENILEEKQEELRRRNREKIADALIEKTSFALPEMIVRREAEALREEREQRVAALKTTMAEYLKKLNLTEEKAAQEERAAVERQLRTKFIFEKIATAENLTAEPEAVEWNAKLLAERHPDADPEHLRHYVASMILNQKVLDILEGVEAKTQSEK